eukprot:GHVN01105642.1.p1 GENE.GHVN01105642.1~~GHVN01105642.1.p1  ORF type:complete len:411 (+),score=92.00 GHVN01105642.1:35-1234(+)
MDDLHYSFSPLISTPQFHPLSPQQSDQTAPEAHSAQTLGRPSAGASRYLTHIPVRQHSPREGYSTVPASPLSPRRPRSPPPRSRFASRSPSPDHKSVSYVAVPSRQTTVPVDDYPCRKSVSPPMRALRLPVCQSTNPSEFSQTYQDYGSRQGPCNLTRALPPRNQRYLTTHQPHSSRYSLLQEPLAYEPPLAPPMCLTPFNFNMGSSHRVGTSHTRTSSQLTHTSSQLTHTSASLYSSSSRSKMSDDNELVGIMWNPTLRHPSDHRHLKQRDKQRHQSSSHSDTSSPFCINGQRKKMGVNQMTNFGKSRPSDASSSARGSWCWPTRGGGANFSTLAACPPKLTSPLSSLSPHPPVSAHHHSYPLRRRHGYSSTTAESWRSVSEISDDEIKKRKDKICCC